MNTWLFSRLEHVDNLIPPHEVDDCSKLHELQSNLRSFGWIGPPIIIIGQQALTGTHRIAAAKSSGISHIPVIEYNALGSNHTHELPTDPTRENLKAMLNLLSPIIRDKYDACVSDTNADNASTETPLASSGD